MFSSSTYHRGRLKQEREKRVGSNMRRQQDLSLGPYEMIFRASWESLWGGEEVRNCREEKIRKEEIRAKVNKYELHLGEQIDRTWSNLDMGY